MINFIINSGLSFFSLREGLVSFFLNKGENIKIYSPNNINKIKKKFKKKNLAVQKFDLLGNKQNIKSLLVNCYNFHNKMNIKSKEINVIFGSYLSLVFGLVSLFQKSKQNIFVFTGLGSYFNQKNKMSIFFLRYVFNFILLKKNSFFIFYNIADRDLIVKKNLRKKTKIILGSGIQIKKKKKSIKSKFKTINFVYYSRFNYDKGINQLIEAIHITNKKGYQDKYKMFMYGLFDDNPSSISRTELMNNIKQFKNCFMTEINYNFKLDHVFKNKHIFVLPSHREGLPKTALEAMTYNQALLLSNIPGHKYLINRKKPNGIFFKKKNAEDLSNKIIFMIKNKKIINSYKNNSFLNLEKFVSSKVNNQFYETIKK